MNETPESKQNSVSQVTRHNNDNVIILVNVDRMRVGTNVYTNRCINSHEIKHKIHSAKFSDNHSYI